jgi:hypothetical protein
MSLDRSVPWLQFRQKVRTTFTGSGATRRIDGRGVSSKSRSCSKGTAVYRLVVVVLVSEDEISVHQFEADSADSLARAVSGAEMRARRIVAFKSEVNL